MLLADCGTSWSKLLNISKNSIEVLNSREMLEKPGLSFALATGHLGKRRSKRFENELIALAKGALSMVDEDSFIVVDIGSRDIKAVEFKDRKSKKIEWNQSCGATTGFTIEILGNYFNLDYTVMAPSKEKFPVTCGVFGMEKIFDTIIATGDTKGAVASFINGIAGNVFTFAKRPERIYLSGGLCENNCFTTTLSNYCEVVKLGRGVLLEGLKKIWENERC